MEKYNSTIKINNLEKVLNEAIKAGYNTYVVINGLYYSIEKEGAQNENRKAQ